MHPKTILSLLSLATTALCLPLAATDGAAATVLARQEGDIFGFGENADGAVLIPIDKREGEAVEMQARQDGEVFEFGEDANGAVLIPIDKE